MLVCRHISGQTVLIRCLTVLLSLIIKVIVIALILFFYYFFLQALQPISMKFSDLTFEKIYKIITRHLFGRHFRSRDIKDFMFLIVRDFSQKLS